MHTSNIRKRFFDKPGYFVSYQGSTTYEVGPLVSDKGHPKVEVRSSLSHWLISQLNDPDTFWTEYLHLVGTVQWRYCPWHEDYHHQFPDPEAAAMFPGYKRARFTPDWHVETDGEPPILVADNHFFETLVDHEQAKVSNLRKNVQILWQGTAPEMTKALWFELIFPHLYPSERSRTVQFLVKKGVEIPPHPPIPDTPYVYQHETYRWQVRLDRTYQPTQFLKVREGWANHEHEATTFYTKQEAEAALANLG